ISDGIVSRTPGNDVLQISAPVSPGNSGGPGYGEYGNLLGGGSSKGARSMGTESGSLNFAISTDNLLHESDWDLAGTQRARKAFANLVRQAKVRRTPAGSHE